MIFPVIVAIAKMEERYIQEWVEYHLALGFKHVYLYDNEDKPIYGEILKNYPVTVTHFPGNNFSKGVQYLILDHFVEHFMEQSTHVLHIDIDEFVVLKKHNNIIDFINEYISGYCVGIAINWRFFGASGHKEPSNEPVTLRFTMCSNDGNKHIKTLFKTTSFLNWNTVHDISTKGGSIKSTKRNIITGPFNENIDLSVIQLNHYKSKTLPEFTESRLRGRADFTVLDKYTNDIFETYNVNDVEDLTAHDFYLKNCLN